MDHPSAGGSPGGEAEGVVRVLDEGWLLRALELVPDLTSAARELCENALDAGATRISLQLVCGERRCAVSCSDNGRGISACEFDSGAALGVRHATSKQRFDPAVAPSKRAALSHEHQQHHMPLPCGVSFGMRGEALCALGRISTLTIESRCRGDAGRDSGGADDATTSSLSSSNAAALAVPPHASASALGLAFRTVVRDGQVVESGPVGVGARRGTAAAAASSRSASSSTTPFTIVSCTDLFARWPVRVRNGAHAGREVSKARARGVIRQRWRVKTRCDGRQLSWAEEEIMDADAALVADVALGYRGEEGKLEWRWAPLVGDGKRPPPHPAPCARARASLSSLSIIPPR